GSDPDTICDFLRASQRNLIRGQKRKIKTGVKTHGINFRRHPMIERDRPRQIAIKSLSIQERTEIQFLFNYRLPSELNSLFCRLAVENDVIPRTGRAKKDTHLFKELSEDRNPMPKGWFRFVTIAQNPA